MTAPKKNINKEIISLFSGQSNTITTPKLYVELTNNHSLAVVLNQCVYWSNKSKLENGWFYKEYDDWFEEIHIPERTLRRRFDKLEAMGFISTKIKKAQGLNTKHILIHMDSIIEGISNMLDVDCPNRPNCPDGSDSGQNPCTKNTPTGQSGRLEPATLADSTIYTDDYFQKKLTNCESSSSFSFSKTLDQKLLEQKLERDKRPDEEFMENVIDHVENHSDNKYSRIVRAQAALKLLQKLNKDNVIFYSSSKTPSENQPKKPVVKKNVHFNADEESLLSEYKQGLKLGKPEMFFIAKPERFKLAQEVFKKEQELIKLCHEGQNLPETNARRNSLMSASSLVSHLS